MSTTFFDRLVNSFLSLDISENDAERFANQIDLAFYKYKSDNELLVIAKEFYQDYLNTIEALKND